MRLKTVDGKLLDEMGGEWVEFSDNAEKDREPVACCACGRFIRCGYTSGGLYLCVLCTEVV